MSTTLVSPTLTLPAPTSADAAGSVYAAQVSAPSADPGVRHADPEYAAVHLLDHQPGNGTRYRLTVVLQHGAIRTIAWPDVGWSAGDLGTHVSAEWLYRSACSGRKRGFPAFTKADAEAIAAVVNRVCEAGR